MQDQLRLHSALSILLSYDINGGWVFEEDGLYLSGPPPSDMDDVDLLNLANLQVVWNERSTSWKVI